MAVPRRIMAARIDAHEQYCACYGDVLAAPGLRGFDGALSVIQAAGGDPELYDRRLPLHERLGLAADALAELAMDTERQEELKDKVVQSLTSRIRPAWTACDCDVGDCLLRETRMAWEAEPFNNHLDHVRKMNGGSLGLTRTFGSIFLEAPHQGRYDNRP